MQDPKTIQEDDIKIKDKQSNSENYKEENNQESEKESNEGENKGESHESDSQREVDDDSKNQDNISDDENSFYPIEKKHNLSSHHSYSEIVFTGGKVFELQSWNYISSRKKLISWLYKGGWFRVNYILDLIYSKSKRTNHQK